MRSLRICLPLATLCSGIMVSGFWAEPRVADISQARRMTTAIWTDLDRKSTRLNCHGYISYAVFCLKKKKNVTEKYKKVMVAPLAPTTSIFKRPPDQKRYYVFISISPAEAYLEALIDTAAKHCLNTLA